MINLLISLGLAAATTVGLGLYTGFGLASFPGVVVAIASYLLLARRTNKQLEALMPEVQKALAARKPEEAIRLLKSARELGRWQFLVAPVLDAQIGMIHYTYQQNFEAARPFLEQAYVKQWQAKLMLAALHFQKKRWEEMTAAFEEATKHNKKAGLTWAAWAWCEARRGNKTLAIEILGKGLKAQPEDEKLKANLLNLQNGKKMKMKAYAEEWWALLLEKPPVQMVGMGGKPVRGGMRQKRGGRRR
ncbi:MAG: hypothetical protein P1V51_19140 [Deltaproteobacteria bacterium]|nr:hypothetical protein [Deltaproteobacteria bacterium]